MIDRFLFGRNSEGISYYHFGNRAKPQPVDMVQASKLRTAALVTLVITALLVFGGVSYFAALSIVLALSPGGVDVLSESLGFNARLLYLAEAGQALLIGLTLLVYHIHVRQILKR